MKKVFTILWALNFLFSFSYSQSDEDVIRHIFGLSDNVSSLSTRLIKLSVNAVWLASELTGQATITGTLTQNRSNPNYWSYSSSPTDKLVLVFATGETISFAFSSIDGYTEGDADDFVDSHYMDFVSVMNNVLNLRIVSNTWPDENKTINWRRSISGLATFDEVSYNFSVQHNGTKEYQISSGYAFYKYNETVSGTATASGVSANLNDGFHTEMGLNSNTNIFVKSTQLNSNSSISINNVSYQFANVSVFWVGGTHSDEDAQNDYFNEVVEPYNWSCSGNLLKNNQVYGTVEFSGAVIEGTSGPYLIAALNNGNQILLHPLLNLYTAEVNTDEMIANKLVLEQNYPNPFNPTTTIEYFVPERSFVNLSVYDATGRKVAELVNEEVAAGNYKVQFNASNLASGVYFYRLKANGKISVRKMTLLK